MILLLPIMLMTCCSNVSYVLLLVMIYFTLEGDLFHPSQDTFNRVSGDVMKCLACE